MNQVEKVKDLCRKNSLPLYKLEKALGFANGYIGQLKKGTIPADRLQKIADYFGMPMEYFLTDEYEEQEEKKVYYVDKDAADIAQEIFENPYMRTLFHAAKGIEPRRLQLVTNILLDFKETNPNG